MPTASSGVSDMLVTVKSREVQRALFAESSGDRDAARRHFLAAAHLELVLAHDYEAAGESALAFRSRLSSASCLWRGGEIDQASRALETVRSSHPGQAAAIDAAVAELRRDYPTRAA